MGEASQATTALLTEHLQYTPLSLIDDIINSVNNLVYQGITSLENGLISTDPARLGFKAPPTSQKTGDDDGDEAAQVAKQELEEGLHQLETLLESTVDKNFDKFEIYVLRNIMSVPDELTSWVQLKHYKDLPSIPPNAPTQESVQLLRRKVTESQRLGSHLRAEVARNDRMIAQMGKIINGASTSGQNFGQDLSFLSSTPSAKALGVSSNAPDSRPLTTNTSFALSQLPALQSLLLELRQKSAGLQEIISSSRSARVERGDERREYIEQRTEIHLQRNPSRLAGDLGSVPGKRVEPEEVEALEKVAEIFEKG